jgi:hypothetical protein
MGYIHARNKQIQKAFNAWIAVYGIAKPINLAPVLRARASRPQWFAPGKPVELRECGRDGRAPGKVQNQISSR